jgi:hypothetical protein
MADPLDPLAQDDLLSRLSPALRAYVLQKRAPVDVAGLDAALASDREREGLNTFAQNLDRSASLYRGERPGPLAVQAPDDVKAFVMRQQLAGKPGDPLERLKDAADVQSKLTPKPVDPDDAPPPPEWKAPSSIATRKEARSLGYGPKAPEAADALEEDLVARAKSLGVPTDKRKREPVIADILAAERAGKDRNKDERTAKNDATKAEIELRKEFIGQQGYKDFQAVATAKEKIDSASPSGAGDMALIYGFMKLMDPGSTVREGEYATASQTGSLPQTLVAQYNRVIKGERLAPEVRDAFKAEAASTFAAQRKRYERLAGQYRGLAKKYGLDPERVVFEPGRELPTTTTDSDPLGVR